MATRGLRAADLLVPVEGRILNIPAAALQVAHPKTQNLVLVKDENLPPMKWPLASVIELLFGGDGVARVAVLKTASGVTKRAVNKLCLLPLKDDVETQASNGGSMSGHAAAAAN